MGSDKVKTITIYIICGVLAAAIIAGMVFGIVKLANNNELPVDNQPDSSSSTIDSNTFSDTNDSSSNSSSNSSSQGNNSVSGNSSNQGNTTNVANPGNWAVVKKATMPTISGQSMTRSEMEKLYRPHTEWRIYEIRTTKTEIKPKSGGTAYYISNKGSVSNDGLTPETPFKNANQLKKVNLKAGDVVYFERGSVFRSSFTADVEGVTYSAYGEGKKPEFYTSYQDFASSELWESTDQKNVYLCTEKIYTDVGNIVFEEKTCAYKVMLAKRDNGDTYNYSDGKDFKDYHDFSKDLQFYHDASSGKLYLRCDKGNPGKIFDRIELSIKGSGIKVTAKNVTIDNLCVKYVGSHGVASGSNEGLTVQNCEFGWIGGAIASVSSTGIPTRFGNGVEIYGSAKNFTVKNCYFYQNYDAGPTFQYKSSAANAPKIVMSNIKFTDNVMEYCNYSIEYFLTASKDSYIEKVTIDGNLMWYAGEGFCSQRPDKNRDAHIKSWMHENRRKGDFKVTNNLFVLAQNYLSETYDITDKGAVYSSNIYIQYVNNLLGQNAGNKEPPKFGTVAEAEKRIKSEFKDYSAKVICITGD